MAKGGAAYVVAAFVFGFDQLTKWIVTGPLGINAHGDQLKLIPFFNLTYTENHGISLGLLTASSDAARWMLVAMTSIIALAVAYWISREKQRADQIALGMVLGGALGNILDRVRFGYVVDFADLHFGEFRPFLIFNVGDAAISIAVVVLLLRAFLVRKDGAEDADPEEKIEHA
ncbi:MAG TPA: signal peptidase II [Sphingomicrobium sp.]